MQPLETRTINYTLALYKRLFGIFLELSLKTNSAKALIAFKETIGLTLTEIDNLPVRDSLVYIATIAINGKLDQLNQLLDQLP